MNSQNICFHGKIRKLSVHFGFLVSLTQSSGEHMVSLRAYIFLKTYDFESIYFSLELVFLVSIYIY